MRKIILITQNKEVPLSIKILSRFQILAIDTETERFDPHTCKLLSLQIGNEHVQYVIDAQTVNIKLYKELLETKIILMHNAKFDLQFLYHQGIIPFGNVICTYLAERVLSMGIDSHRKSLQACVYRYLKVIMPKEVRGLIHKLGIRNQRVVEYAAKDVEHLVELWRYQEQLLKEKDLLDALALDNLYVCVLAYTEYFGFGIKTSSWTKSAKQDLLDLEEIKNTLDTNLIKLGLRKFMKQPDLFNPKWTSNVNWSSSKQVIPLFRDLGLNLQVKDKKTGEYKDSVEAPVIKKQVNLHPIVPIYLQHQKIKKLTTTYGLDFLRSVNKVTRRIHTNFAQLMNTGRLSSGGNGSVNLQNIPVIKRSHFITKPGNKFIVCDYSG